MMWEIIDDYAHIISTVNEVYMLDTTRPAVDVQGISKSYASVQAVHELSFSVNYGEIFGLLGPNGAGKTTTIRMILDIIKPSSGQIKVFGGAVTEAAKARIGYLPEERGLYEDMTLLDTLLFLGQLKNLSRKAARAQAEIHLREIGLWEARALKVQALSRGMRQKAQFVAAIMHKPDLIIIDEPFSGLDPVNTRLIKNLIYRMRDYGAAIIMSTHQMYQVEEMCQRILLVDHGRQVLYGPLNEIRRQFANNAVTAHNGAYRILLQDGLRPQQLLKSLVNMPHLTVERFEQVEVSLDEIFVQVVGRPLKDDEEQAHE